MEAVILAGGMGTRLKAVLEDIPKPMAIIAGKPFLWYLFKYLKQNNINKVILSVGYKFGVIKNFFGDCYDNINILYSIENEPLGTGGALKRALCYAECDEVFVFNGDSYFQINCRTVL